MKADVLTTISTSLDELNQSEGKVAQYILTHTRDVVHLSIALLSQKAGVSEPTVIRFCRNMGCKGYQDFKLQLATSLASGQRQSRTVIDENDSPLRIAEKTCANAAHSLQVLQKSLNITDIEHALELLRSAKRIEIYGSGSSGIVALAAQYKLCTTKVPTVAHRDSQFQLISASNLNDDYLALVICSTGESATIIDVAQRARQQGATVLGITQKGSPLSQHCHTVMHCPKIESTGSSSLSNSMIYQLTIVDILVAALF